VSQKSEIRTFRTAWSPALLTLAFAIGLVAGSAPAAAQSTAVGGPRTPTAGVRLGELYDEARTRSPRVEAARSLARAAEAVIRAAHLPEDPQLQLGLMNRSLSGFDPMPGIGMTQISLMQMVPVAGQPGIRGGIARAQARAASERAGETEWEVRASVAMAFYDLYSTDRQLAVTRETLRLLQDILRTAESMYRVGEGRQTDVLRAHVEVARMSEDTLRMRAMRETMVARLGALLDRAEIVLGEPILPAFPLTIPAAGDLQQRALESRRMLRAATAEVDAARSMQRLARREIWPDLQLGIAYAQGPGIGTMESPAGNERMASVMIGARVPIFARSRQLSMRQEAAAMEQMTRAELADMAAETRGRVAAAYADLERARRLQRLYRTSILPQASAAVQSALSAYRVGAVDFMTLLDNQMTVNEYRGQLAVLEADEGKAWAELEMLVADQLLDSNSSAAAVAAGGSR
jgi:outer membrane protein, heavy metal efflux system